MKRSLSPLAALLSLSPILLFAQAGRPASPPPTSITVDAGMAGAGDFTDSAGRSFKDIDVTHFGTSVARAFAVDAQTFVSLGFEYERVELGVDERFVPLPESVQSLAAKATVRRVLNEQWALLSTLEVGFANADDPFDSGGLGLKASVLALYRQSETFTWGFGVIYRSLAKNDLRVLPAIGFDWRPNPQWNVVVGFPRTAVIRTVTEQLKASFGVSARGGTYYVKDAVGAALSSLAPVRDTLLDYTEIRVGLGLEYRPAPAWEFSAAIGMIVHQNLDYFERDYELEADDASAFVSIGARYSF